MNEEILQLIKELRPEFDFEGSNNFIEDGYLDSFDITSLISELEARYDCLIDGVEILPENFSTVDSIVNLVKKSM